MASRCWATKVSSVLSCFCSDWPITVRGDRRKNSKTRLIPNGRAAIYRSALAMISTSGSVIKCPYAQSQTALTFKRFPDPFNAPSRPEFQHQLDPRLMTGQHSAQDRAHLSQLAARAFVGVSVEHTPARAARRDDDRKAGVDGALDRGQSGDCDVAATQAFDHQTARPVADCEVDESPVRPGDHLNYVNALFYSVRDDALAPDRVARDDYAVFVHDS